MKTLGLLSVLLAGAVAAAPEAPKPVTVAMPYRAGERLLLVYSTDFSMTPKTGAASYELSVDKAGNVQKKNLKVEPSPGTATEFGTMELPLVVAAGDKAGQVRVAMTARRMISGHKMVRSDEEIRQSLQEVCDAHGAKPTPTEIEADMKKAREEICGEVFDTADPKPAKPEAVASLKDSIELADFAATMADGRRLADFAPRGKVLDALQKVKDSKERAGQELYLTGRYRSLLEDTVAYLPPQAVMAGQSWRVERKEVVPLHLYATYMLTGGIVLTESSECTFEGVHDSPQGRVAVIKVRGRRVPTPPPSGEGPATQPGKFFETRGEVQVNPDTGALVSLRLESTLVWKDKDSPGDVVFIDSATLAPLGK
jgi:hypothetical protein